MVEADLFLHLKTTTAISSLVGSRIYPLVAPENCATPFIVYSNISDVDQTSFQGANYQNKTRFQIDIYSKSYGEVKTLKGAVKVAMYDFKYFPHEFTSRDLYEADTKIQRQLIQFKLNN